ncbi:uncharacterized protein LOC142230342 isoform X2 [Haematobia irritans]|uniref:uncharacterized protein LOC142230342 isoform X2 n=1 Tax=Haematobia irritans TaxID=7368 RepID=UPI003F4F9B12
MELRRKASSTFSTFIMNPGKFCINPGIFPSSNCVSLCCFAFLSRRTIMERSRFELFPKPRLRPKHNDSLSSSSLVSSAYGIQLLMVELLDSINGVLENAILSRWDINHCCRHRVLNLVKGNEMVHTFTSMLMKL